MSVEGLIERVATAETLVSSGEQRDRESSTGDRTRERQPSLTSLPRMSAVGILSGLQIIFSVVLILLVLMHSGKDSGLSGAFGVGSGAGPFGGGSLVERNLDRWTIGFALLWVVNVIALVKL